MLCLNTKHGEREGGRKEREKVEMCTLTVETFLVKVEENERK